MTGPGRRSCSTASRSTLACRSTPSATASPSCTENRKEEGLVLPHSVERNIIMAALRSFAGRSVLMRLAPSARPPERGARLPSRPHRSTPAPAR
jgi:ABC-type sugar transport system ATPase subunit